LLSIPLATGGAVDIVHGDLLGADADGLAVLGVALGYGVLAAACFRRDRDFSTLLWGWALVLAAAAFPVLVSGRGLVLAWSPSAAVTAVLAARVRARRFLVAAYSYLGLTLAYTLATPAPPRDLFVSGRHPADGVVALVFVIAAAALTALICWRTAPMEAGEGESGTAVAPKTRQRDLALATIWGAAFLTAYAASLLVLEVAEAVSSGSVGDDFQRGHVAVSALWGVLGLALLYFGLVRQAAALRYAGFVAFGVAVGKIFLYDLSNLSAMARALSFLGVGAVLLLG